MADRFVLGENGRPTLAQQEATVGFGEIRPYKSAELTFTVDPEKPKGTRKMWRLLEECPEMAPIMGNLYLPKWLRLYRGRPAIPLKVKVTFQVEYCQIDPALVDRNPADKEP